MPWGSTEEPDVIKTEKESVPVHVVSTSAKPGKSVAPEFARFRSFLVSNAAGAGTSVPGAQRILNRSLRRHEARIIVNPTIAAQAVTDGTMIGGREEMTSGMPMTPGSIAGYLQWGDNLTYKGQGELWVAFPATNVNAVWVTVLDMQYASDSDAWREEK